MRYGLGLAFCLGLAAHAGAAPALTVDEIVARHVEALGGAERLAAVRSLRLTGTDVIGGGDFRIDAEWALLVARPGQVRSEVSLQGLTAIDAFDGKDAWSVQPFDGRRDAQKTSADEAKDLAREAEAFGPLAGWRERGHRVEYLGTEDVDGTPAHKLRVARKDGDTQYVYLDPDYWLAIRVVTESRVRGVERVTETDLGGYAQVAGVWIPMSRESGPKGRPPRERVTIRTAEANVEVDATAFAAARRTGDGPPDRREPERARAVGRAAGREAGGGAAAVDRRRRPLRPRRAQHRLGHHERPHLGDRRAQRGRQDDRVRRRGERRGVALPRRRHDVQAGLRRECRPVDRRDRHRPVQPAHGLGRDRRELDAQLRVRRRRHLQVDRQRRDVDERGPARVRADRADRRRPEERRRRLRVRARPALERQRRARRLQDDATAGRAGASS